jgi:chitodextrinase/predicted chitinase
MLRNRILRKRILIPIGTLVVTAALALVLPMTSASAAACTAPAWNTSIAYVGGSQVTFNGRQYTANWWTQGHRPDQYSGQWQEWRDDGACTGGGGTSPPPPPPLPPPGGGGTCNLPAWTEGPTYQVGTRVSYSGSSYEAIVTHTAHPGANWNPASTPTLWRQLSTCGGTTQPPPPPPPPPSGGFVVTEAQFNQMFPSRNSFYTYAGLTAAMNSFPAFARTGSDTVRRQEAAAFLANVSHETGGLVHIVEQNTANYPHYCDPNQPYGCPAGQAAYYGRGPIQLSWNFNYKAAGDALGINLLADPWRVEREAAVAWQTGLWYWMTQNGPGTMTAHNAMVNGAGFGQTIRSINGSIECNGGNPAQVQSRVAKYQQVTGILGVTPGGNLTC